MTHANLPWTFGPLCNIVVSPASHRWHHTMDEEGQGKNFAGLFSFYDVLFGTYYLPSRRQPGNFGLGDEAMTENFIGQMLYPFRNWPILKRFRQLRY